MNFNMDREYLIGYILTYSVNANKEGLEKMSVEALVMIKVQIEIELAQKFYN